MKHYFLDYTDEELIEVIQRQDEWSQFDTDMAETILKDRGIELSEEKRNELKEIRLTELAKPEQPDSWYIPAGYIFCALGGIFGFAIGLSLVNARKKIAAKSVFKFNERSRTHGKVMLIIGAIGVIGSVLYLSNK